MRFPTLAPQSITARLANAGVAALALVLFPPPNEPDAVEINRTPPRTQAALLEAMQERRVSVDGKTHRLPDPFLVVATQNPFEHEGIFPLPESQLDRFLFKINLDYAGEADEIAMLRLP